MPFSSSKLIEMGQLCAAPSSLASPSLQDRLESSAVLWASVHFSLGDKWKLCLPDADFTMSWQHLSARTPWSPGPASLSRCGHSAGRGRLRCRHQPPAPPRSRPLSKLSFKKGSFCYKWCLYSHRKDNEVIALKAFSIFFKEKIHLRSFHS